LNVPLHEAAHACMAHLLGFELHAVWAEDGHGESVDCGPAGLFAEGFSHREVGVREALVSLAPIAVGEEVSKGDLACFHRAVWLASLSEPERLIKRELTALAKEILCTTANRMAVAAVADQLNRRRYLTGAEVVGIIDGTRKRGFIV